MHTNTAKYAHFTHQFLYGLVIDHKLLLQFFCNSPISVTPFAFLINAAYFSFDFSISIWLWMIKLLAVIVVGTAGNIGNLNEQSYFMFMPQLSDCRSTASSCGECILKKIECLGCRAGTAREKAQVIRSSSFLIFGGRPVDFFPLRSM